MKPRTVIKERISGKGLGGSRTAEIYSYFFNSAIVRTGTRHSPLCQDQTQAFLSSLNDSNQRQAQTVTTPAIVQPHVSSPEDELSQADIEELSHYFPDLFRK